MIDGEAAAADLDIADAPETEVAPAAEIDATAENPVAEHEGEAEVADDAAEDAPEAPGEPESDASDEANDAAPALEATEAPNGDTLIPLTHPEGGTTDALPKDEHGNFLCAAKDAVTWFAHGFVVAAEKVEEAL